MKNQSFKNQLIMLLTIIALAMLYAFVNKDNPDVVGDIVETTVAATTAVETESASEAETTPAETITAEVETTQAAVLYKFRNAKLLADHYEKHGKEMGFSSESAYEEAASAVINNKDALYKTEKEDGDGVFYIEATNEFVVLSKDGYIRTYFNPSAGIEYFNRQ